MADPDDIDKLLRDIDAMNNPAASRSALPGSDESRQAAPAKPIPSGGGSRGAWAGAGALGGLAVGGLFGVLMPFFGSVQTGVGAAIGGALVGFLSHPPDWFSRD